MSAPSNADDSTTSDVPPPISLSASPYKAKSAFYVDLSWSGADGTDVEIWRDGQLFQTTPNDGLYTDTLGKKPNPGYLYQVCETGALVCSDEVAVSF